MKKILLLILLPLLFLAVSCDKDSVANKKYRLMDTDVVLEFKADGYVYFCDTASAWRKYKKDGNIIKLAELDREFYSEYYLIYDNKLIKIEKYYEEIPEKKKD